MISSSAIRPPRPRSVPRSLRPLLAMVAAASLVLSACGGSSSTPAAADAAVETTAAAAAPETAAPNAYGDLDPTAFQAAAQVPGRVLIDVRTPEEFAAGHLAGAIDMDFYATDFAAKVQALDPAAEYLVYCHSGNRSGQAVAIMAQAGITKVFNLAGGVTAWGAAGLPMVTG